MRAAAADSRAAGGILSLPERTWLAIIIAGAILLRIAAFAVLAPPVESDGLAYLTMAQSLVETGIATDNFGQQAFYSAGYPYFLAPFTALFGATANTGIFANLVLTAGTAVLIWKLAMEAGLVRWQRLAVTGAFAVWLPGIWNASLIARENLSVPLLLLVLLSAVSAVKGRHRALLWGGAAYGLGVLTGGSSLLIAIAPLGALFLCRSFTLKQRLQGGGLFALAAAAVLLPWMIHTANVLGSPVLNTNGGFNLYLGNNPAATGRFVSIADTPAGPQWNTMREELGEVESSQVLADAAKAHMIAHPVETAGLAAKKLGLFWLPNIPDRADIAASPVIATVRMVEVLQYALIVIFAAWGFWKSRLDTNIKIVLLAIIAGFWVIHAAAYIIPRYRDPVMPVLMLAAISAFPLRVQNWTKGSRNAA